MDEHSTLSEKPYEKVSKRYDGKRKFHILKKSRERSKSPSEVVVKKEYISTTDKSTTVVAITSDCSSSESLSTDNVEHCESPCQNRALNSMMTTSSSPSTDPSDPDVMICRETKHEVAEQRSVFDAASFSKEAQQIKQRAQSQVCDSDSLPPTPPPPTKAREIRGSTPYKEDDEEERDCDEESLSSARALNLQQQSSLNEENGGNDHLTKSPDSHEKIDKKFQKEPTNTISTKAVTSDSCSNQEIRRPSGQKNPARRVEDYKTFFETRKEVSESDRSRPRSAMIAGSWSYRHSMPSKLPKDKQNNLEPSDSQPRPRNPILSVRKSALKREVVSDDDFLLDDPGMAGKYFRAHTDHNENSAPGYKKISTAPNRRRAVSSPYYEMTDFEEHPISNPDGPTRFNEQRRRGRLYSSMPKLNHCDTKEKEEYNGQPWANIESRPRPAMSWGHLGPTMYHSQGQFGAFNPETVRQAQINQQQQQSLNASMFRNIFPYTTLHGRPACIPKYPGPPMGPAASPMNPMENMHHQQTMHQFSFRHLPPMTYGKRFSTQAARRMRMTNGTASARFPTRKTPPRIYEIFADESHLDSDGSFIGGGPPPRPMTHGPPPYSINGHGHGAPPGMGSLMFMSQPYEGRPQSPVMVHSNEIWPAPPPAPMPGFMGASTSSDGDSVRRKSNRSRNCMVGWMLGLTALIILALAVALFIQVSKDANQLNKLRSAVAAELAETSTEDHSG